MPQMATSQYNDPAFAQTAGNIAAMFAPPSGMDMAGYANASATRAKAARDAALAALAANPNTTRDMIDRAAVGDQAYTPIQSFYAQDQNNATTQRGQNLDLEAKQQALVAQPLAPGSTLNLPASIASSNGVAPVLSGAPTMDTVKAIAFNKMPLADQTEVNMQGVTPVPVRNADGSTSIENPQQAIADKARPAVVPGSAQQTFLNADANNQATDYNAILNSGRQAQSRMNVLNVLDQASKGAGYQGIGGTNAMALRQALAAFGIDTAKESDAEVLQSGGSQLALQMRNPANGGGMPGSMSDGDRQFLASMVAGLDHTPQGNAKLIAVAKAIAQRDIDTATAATNYVNKYGVLDGNFTAQQAHFNDTHPILPGMPANPKDQSDYDALPSGMTYIDPGDGQAHVKP